MKPIVLCIMDGVGIREEKEGNAFLMADTPNYDNLWNKYPHSALVASGKEVGIPKGQMGNSEVGHMNIGAGRIVRQPLELINSEIKTKDFFKNKNLLEVVNHVKSKNSRLHIIGLLSDGGIHSHINHIFALLDLAKEQNIKELYLHVILDGRDTEKNIALKFLDSLNTKIKKINLGIIASISGRYYAMDRDNRWDRTEKSYNVIIKGVGNIYNSYEEVITENYNKEIYDEFIEPSILNKNGMINSDDGVIIANFRSDRLRQIGIAITNSQFDKFETKTLGDIKVANMFPVDKEIESITAYKIKEIENDIGEYISELGLKQLRIAETEKYPHVTIFFDGGESVALPNSDKILIPSPNVATYDLKPEMSANEITSKAIETMNNYDLIILNYANGDMVGHTGNFKAAIKAVETIDKCIQILYNKIKEIEGTLIITADHGNCEDMTGIYEKTHTTNKVPFIICRESIELNDGKLGDIAPTILKLMNIEIPKEMTGNVLIK